MHARRRFDLYAVTCPTMSYYSLAHYGETHRKKPEIFMECYCVARNKPISWEITKPQTATVISKFFVMFACISWTLLWVASTQSTFQTFFRCSRFSKFDSKTFIFKYNVCKLNFSKRLVTFSDLSLTNQSILSHLLTVLLWNMCLNTTNLKQLPGTMPKLLTKEWNFFFT